MTDTAAKAEPEREKGSPAFLIILVVILGISLLLGTWVGAGGASVIGGFVALFGLLATMGGPLRADLRRLLIIGPLIAFSAVAPRLLAEVSVAGAFALITILVFVAGLLPLRAKRYDTVALGVGMGALLGYAIPLADRTDARQLLLAAVVGLVVAVALRILLGIADPSGPTRKAIAGLLDGTSSDFSAAFDTWLSDRPSRWLADVLFAAGRYRLARRVLTGSKESDRTSAQADVLVRLETRATRIAESVSEKKPATPEDQEPEAPIVIDGDRLHTDAVEAMEAALDQAERAAQERTPERIDIPRSFRRTLSIAAVRSGLRHGSIQVRHAARAAIAVLIALLVSLFLEPGDPLLPTLLATAFVIVQTSWRATLSRARDRLLGIIIGGLLVVVIILAAPESWLLPISMLGLAVGLWFITARPAIGTAGILVMSVGLNSELRQLDPWAVVTEYVILTAIAVLIGGLIGFVIVPAWRPPAIRERADDALDHTATALSSLASDRSADAAERALRALGAAQGAVQQLVPDRETLTPPQQESLEDLRTGLQDLIITALFVRSSSSDSDQVRALNNAATILTSPADQQLENSAADRPLEDALLALATAATDRHAGLKKALG